MQKQHPLCLIKEKIANYIYKKYPYKHPAGMPEFSLHENLSPVVTTEQNFDSLLVPGGHVSRRRSDSYYLDSGHLLRAPAAEPRVLEAAAPEPSVLSSRLA